jgi:hypothetical protein
MPYYTVKNKETGKVKLVESDNRAQAYRMVGEAILDVAAASTADVAKFLEAGGKIERKVETHILMPLSQQ